MYDKPFLKRNAYAGRPVADDHLIDFGIIDQELLKSSGDFWKNFCKSLILFTCIRS